VCVSKCVRNVGTVILLSDFNQYAGLRDHRQFRGFAAGSSEDVLGFDVER
jgi:hypothetical protein